MYVRVVCIIQRVDWCCCCSVLRHDDTTVTLDIIMIWPTATRSPTRILFIFAHCVM